MPCRGSNPQIRNRRQGRICFLEPRGNLSLRPTCPICDFSSCAPGTGASGSLQPRGIGFFPFALWINQKLNLSTRVGHFEHFEGVFVERKNL